MFRDICLLVQRHLSSGSKMFVYWFKDICLLVQRCLISGSKLFDFSSESETEHHVSLSYVETRLKKNIKHQSSLEEIEQHCSATVPVLFFKFVNVNHKVCKSTSWWFDKTLVLSFS